MRSLSYCDTCGRTATPFRSLYLGCEVCGGLMRSTFIEDWDEPEEIKKKRQGKVIQIGSGTLYMAKCKVCGKGFCYENGWMDYLSREIAWWENRKRELTGEENKKLIELREELKKIKDSYDTCTLCAAMGKVEKNVIRAN